MLYGKDWKNMQPIIKTRTLVQIRTHAQKVLNSYNKSDHSTWYCISILEKIDNFQNYETYRIFINSPICQFEE